MDRVQHWQSIYEHKSITDVSWYQQVPTTSLDIIGSMQLPLTASIIDIGGGDSLLVDHLLDSGYTDITVLDISERALEKAKSRLGARANAVHWLVSDVCLFEPERQYDLWHDRAAFHFLTDQKNIGHYLEVLRAGLKQTGRLVVGTFSENGPDKCSGIQVQRYSGKSLSARFRRYFQKIKCIQVEHHTPFNTFQEFVFCSFKKLDLVSS